ncbi:MAG: iron chelate uptake ABC transporter family permease subunit [Planctomycetota bacterium]|nr:iron chelate uptake ABC transporter family permease subunit [Planctomycetota bacterium]
MLAPAPADWPTFDRVLDTLLLRAGFNTNTVIIGTTLLGLAAGVVGVFALLRKRSLTTDALSHATLPGITLAFLIVSAFGGEGRSLPVLLLGATATGVLGVVCIQAMLRHTRLREDAAIGVVLSVFFGAGVVGLSYIQKNASSGAAGLNTFIYGQTAAMRVSDAWLMGGLAIGAVAASAALLKEFTLVCFDDAFAKVGGWPVSLIDLLMMALVVLVTVAGLQAVGLILVVAMLIIPAVSARFWTQRLWLLVVLAGVIGATSGYLGSVLSALLPRKPAGAVIVLTSGVIFGVSLMGAPARGFVASAVRRVRTRLGIATDHLLEVAHDRRDGRGAGLSARDVAGVGAERGWPAWFGRAVLWTLRARGLATTDEGGLRLTDAGRSRGARVSRNHRLWAQYLISHADVAPSHVDWSADQVEHVLPDEVVEALEAQLAEGAGVRSGSDSGGAVTGSSPQPPAPGRAHA